MLRIITSTFLPESAEDTQQLTKTNTTESDPSTWITQVLHTLRMVALIFFPFPDDSWGTSDHIPTCKVDVSFRALLRG